MYKPLIPMVAAPEILFGRMTYPIKYVRDSSWRPGAVVQDSRGMSYVCAKDGSIRRKVKPEDPRAIRRARRFATRVLKGDQFAAETKEFARGLRKEARALTLAKQGRPA